MGSAGEKSSERSPSASPRASRPRPEASSLDPLLGLQQTIGNQAMLRLLRGGFAQPKLRSSSPGNGSRPILQKKCGRCSVGASCSDCAEEDEVFRKPGSESSTAALLISEAGLNFQKSGGDEDPVTVENLPATPDPPKRGKPPNKPVQPPAGSASDIPEITEDLGRAWCDPDQGKVVWELIKTKIPACMLKCAETHELAHVKFGQQECSKVSAVYKTLKDTISESDKARAALKKDPTDTKARRNAEAVTTKLKEAKQKLRNALDAYKKWHDQTCKENERQAYQAGIDACQGAQAEKRCADSKETDRYKRMMKHWEEFKQKPPNC